VYSQRQGRATIVQSCITCTWTLLMHQAARPDTRMHYGALQMQGSAESIKALRAAHAWCTGSVLDAPASAAPLSSQDRWSQWRSGNETAMNLQQRD